VRAKYNKINRGDTTVCIISQIITHLNGVNICAFLSGGIINFQLNQLIPKKKLEKSQKYCADDPFEKNHRNRRYG